MGKVGECSMLSPRRDARQSRSLQHPTDPQFLMSLTIYQMEYSPFCIPITAALRASGAEFETREIPNWDRTELLRLTNGAYYQVPVLVHDGHVVTESSAESEDIARYVDTH